VVSLAKRNGTLRRTRDFLLPLLMSGEVNVENLEMATDGDPIREVAGASQ